MSLHTITSCKKSGRGGADSKGLHFAAEEDDGQCEGEGESEEDG